MIIFVRDLKLSMLIGIYDHEKKVEQEVVVNIEAEVSEPKNWQSDSMDDWVSYETLVDVPRAIAAQGQIDMLETFAHRIADEVLSDQRIKSIQICLEKTAAIAGTRSVGVEYRQNNQK